MYFVSDDSAPVKKSDYVRKLKIMPKITNDIEPELKLKSNKNTNNQKRVYGRARANLSFSSFYIFCEDFRLQLDYLYTHKSETFRKNLLNYMWKHMNTKDKHKYYETATKARAMYNLPEHSYLSENDGKKSTNKLALSSRNNNNNKEIVKSSGSKVVGKLVRIKFSKSCITPIITPLKVQNVVVDSLNPVRGRPQDEVHGFGEGKLRQDHGAISEHQDNGAEHLQPPLDHRYGQSIDERRRRLSGGGPSSVTTRDHGAIHRVICKSPNRTVGTTTTITTSHRPQPTTESTCSVTMLQQYQQQPDYTPYGGIGYGAQPNAGYFNYAATESSSWYGSPSSGGDHAQMHAGLSHNACNSHIGDSTGNFLNHGYHQTPSTGVTSSSVESFNGNNHPVSPANMDHMTEYLGGHQNMNENDKIIKKTLP